MLVRKDGLSEGQEFSVVALYDKDGYYTSVVGLCRDAVIAKTYTKSHNLKSVIACSVPFNGTWIGAVPDVSLPPDFKSDMTVLERIKDQSE